MNDGFEKFGSKSKKTIQPSIYIGIGGVMTFNSAIVELHKLNKYSFACLYFKVDGDEMGIEFLGFEDLVDDDTYNLTRPGSGLQISASRFMSDNQIKIEQRIPDNEISLVGNFMKFKVKRKGD